MKPVLIFCYDRGDGPGYFSTHLARRGVPVRLVRVDAGEAIPAELGDVAGIGLMGGGMSVNDPLPWIGPLLALIRAAVAAGIPVIGHCLGGQLLARALGAAVRRNPVWEIGWAPIRLAACPEAQAWFGPAPDFLGFHWHGETFSIPPGAVRLAGSAGCTNQAFAFGPHLGLQCHVEMTAPMVRDWCGRGAARIGASAGPTVQRPQEICLELDARLAGLQAVAARLYDHWLEGVSGGRPGSVPPD